MNAQAGLTSACPLYRAPSHRPDASAWRSPISTHDADQLRQLLAQCSLGNRQAFETLYRSVSPRLHGVALRFMGRQDLAEDVLQESFVRIWFNASRYEAHLSAPLTSPNSLLTCAACSKTERFQRAKKSGLTRF